MEVSAAVESPKRRSTDSSSPEFEFWMVGNHPSSPNPHLLTADELFVDGVLLPLHLLSLSYPHPEPNPQFDPKRNPEPNSPPAARPAAVSATASIFSAAAPSSGSKRWKDIFKTGDKKAAARGSAELNIHIWPFSRSRSAGRPRPSPAMAGRKATKGSEPKEKVARVLSLNVNTCIGYGNQVSCRDDDDDGVAGEAAGGGYRTSGNGSLFSIRTLFSKKVY